MIYSYFRSSEIDRQTVIECCHRGDVIFNAITCVLLNRKHKNEAFKNLQYSEIFSNYLFTDTQKKRENENGAVLQKMHYEIEMSFGNEFCLNLFY